MENWLQFFVRDLVGAGAPHHTGHCPRAKGHPYDVTGQQHLAGIEPIVVGPAQRKWQQHLDAGWDLGRERRGGGRTSAGFSHPLQCANLYGP